MHVAPPALLPTPSWYVMCVHCDRLSPAALWAARVCMRRWTAQDVRIVPCVSMSGRRALPQCCLPVCVRKCACDRVSMLVYVILIIIYTSLTCDASRTTHATKTESSDRSQTVAHTQVTHGSFQAPQRRSGGRPVEACARVTLRALCVMREHVDPERRRRRKSGAKSCSDGSAGHGRTRPGRDAPCIK